MKRRGRKKQKETFKRIRGKGGLIERMRAHLRVEPNGCWRWVGAHSQKVHRGKKKGPSRPVVWLGPHQDSPVVHVARVALSLVDGVPLSDREGLEAAHVECINAWCWNPEHLAWRTPEGNRLDRVLQYGGLFAPRPEEA
jgi:hypothetical protein